MILIVEILLCSPSQLKAWLLQLVNQYSGGGGKDTQYVAVNLY
jgi:hypothetical protein